MASSDPMSEDVKPVPSTPTADALMDAALASMAERGVLAGLNLRDVADTVGVTSANVYHYFGSRQGLLRSALRREMAQLADQFTTARALPFLEGRAEVFDAITRHPALPLIALLALDEDPDFEPLPFWDETRRAYRDRADRGELPADVDLEMVHLLSLAMILGWATFRRSVARQLDVDQNELDGRARATYLTLLSGMMGAVDGDADGNSTQ